MLLTVLAVILVGAIVVNQVIQGGFSALITAALSVVAACVAFNYAEPLVRFWLEGRVPVFADSIAIIAIFVLTLLALRFLFDYLIRGNLYFPQIANWIIGGACGLLSASVIVGVVLIAWQVLPLPAKFFGYDRYPSSSFDAPSRIFPNPDGFTASLVANLSAKTFSGNQRFEAMHPNLLMELYGRRSAVEAGSLPIAGRDCLEVISAWQVNEVDGNPPAAGQQFIAVRAKINIKQNAEFVLDTDRWLRYSSSQVRVVTHDSSRDRYDTTFIHAIADPRSPTQIVVTQPGQAIAADLTTTTARSPQFDWVFSISSSGTIEFVEFKGWARAEVPALLASAPSALLPRGSGQVGRVGSVIGVGQEPRMRVTEININNQLPFALRSPNAQGEWNSPRGGVVQLQTSQFASGRIGDSAAVLKGMGVTRGKARIGGFLVPPGQYMVEVVFKRGQGATGNSYYTGPLRLESKSGGNMFKHVGAMLRYKQERTERVEIYYYPNGSRDEIEGPQQIDSNGDLFEVRAYFLVPPNLELEYVSVGDYKKQYVELNTKK